MNNSFPHEPTVSQLYNVINLLYSCMDDYLYVYDFKKDSYYISPKAEERFAMPSNPFYQVEKRLASIVHPEDFPLLQADLADILHGNKDVHNLHYRWLSKTGEPLWINCRGRVVRAADGSSSYMVGCINETGAKQRADNVSGLLGESSLHTYIQSLSTQCPTGFLLRLGIDNFKDINENLGLEYGDQILRKTADCISACIEPGQQLFRIVADEFIVLDILGGTTADAEALYKNIRKKIDQFIMENHYEVVYTISAGILGSSLPDSTYVTLMKLSEFSLNEAKRHGKNRSYVFQEKDYSEYIHRKKLIRAMRHAVHNDCSGFEVYFQPIVTASTEKLRGAEALLRFSSIETGPLSPAEFIPLLEETGLIIPVGKWVLAQAIDACKKWRHAIPDFTIHVNLSYVQIMKSHILSEIIAGIDNALLSPTSISVELTESGYLESNPHFTKLWIRLKEYGVPLALDDFGTGYSNLHCLYDLSPDVIKIDRSFTVKALKNNYEYNMLMHIIDMAHSIYLKVCIEGIETPDELDKINQMKPDYIQGYYFGRPCSPEEFTANYIRSASTA